MNTVTQSAIHSFYQQVQNNPDRPALHVEDTYYSYRELASLVTAIRATMLTEGFKGEHVVGVLTIDDVYTYASILAIQASGGAYVPINNKNPLDRNREIIRDTDMRLVLASHPHGALDIPDLDFTTLVTEGIQGQDEIVPPVDTQPDDIAYILFTSGSTGKPKGVPIHHCNLNAFLNVMLDKDEYDFNDNDRFLQMFELTFDMSVSSLFLPLCIGACCYVVPQKGIAYMNIVNQIESHQITVAQMVPSVLSYIERFFDELAFPCVRYSLFAGEGLPASILPGWQAVIPNARIVNLYGPTETTIYCNRYDWNTQLPEADIGNGLVSIGTPFKSTQYCVVDNTLQPIDPREAKGELCLHGPQVTSHYWKNPEKTAASFISLPLNGEPKTFYRTGDLVYINSLGNMMYAGRIDHQVQIDGHRVELGEIDHHLREVAQTPLAATIAKSQPGSNQLTLHAFIEDQGQLDKADINAYLSSKLPPYMVPKNIQLIDQMPINLNGKIDRKALATY
jgi:amino acid adenylation domain-containing protein